MGSQRETQPSQPEGSDAPREGVRRARIPDDRATVDRLWRAAAAEYGRYSTVAPVPPPVLGIGGGQPGLEVASSELMVMLGTVDAVPVALGAFRLLQAGDGGRRQVRVELLYVEPEARGLGVGELTLLAGLAWADSMGVREAEIEVAPGNRAAKAFCETGGFVARRISMGRGWARGEALSDVPREYAEMASVAAAEPPGQGSWIEDRRLAQGGRPSQVLCVGAVVLDAEHLLLVKRGRPPGAELWALPGGRVEPGESLAEAARREVAEETGLDIEILGFLGLAERHGEEYAGGGHYVICDFLARASGGDLLAGDDASEAGWFPLDGLPRPMAPGSREFLEACGIFAGRPGAVYDERG